MATLYWGGGSGVWDAFNASNWYTNFARTTLSSRAPSAEDDVVFDSASHTTSYVLTVGTDTYNLPSCKSISIAAPISGTITISGSLPLYVYGNFTVTNAANIDVISFSSGIYFYGNSSHTLQTLGISMFNEFYFNGTGTYTLQDALVTNTTINFNSGSLITNSYAITCGAVQILGSGSLYLNASTAVIGNIYRDSSATGIIDGGTSNLSVTSSLQTSTSGYTLYNVTFTSGTTSTIELGAGTFNNLTFATRSTSSVGNVYVFGNVVVNGTLTISGQLGYQRWWLRSIDNGVPVTFTVNAVSALTDVDFRDIVVTGASAPWSGTRLGNRLGNSGITFPAAKSVYWSAISGGAWASNSWSNTSGGAPSTAYFPLAQDNVIVNNTGLNTGSSITGGVYAVNDFTSAKTNAWTLIADPDILGNLSLTTSMTVSACTPTFSGRTTQNYASAGNTLNRITISSFGSSVALTQAATFTNITIVSGGLDTNNYSLTIATQATVSPNTRVRQAFTLTLGSSAVTIGGSNGLNGGVYAPLMTVSAGSSVINLTNAAANFGFEGQTLTWGNVFWNTAITTPDILGDNTFAELSFTSPIATQVNVLNIYGNQTITSTLNFNGSNTVIARIGVYSSTIGTTRTLTVNSVSGLVDIDFRDIAVAGASAPWSGTRLGNCGGNSGITFPAAKTVYWNLTGSQLWSSTGWSLTSGGAVTVTAFPLAQDTAVFNNAGSAVSVDMNAVWNVGTINFSSRTNTMTFLGGGSFNLYKDILFSPSVTYTGTQNIFFRGTSVQNITLAGASIPFSFYIYSPNSQVRHADAFVSTGGIRLDAGSYDTQGYNVTATYFYSGFAFGSGTRSINFQTSTITLTQSAGLDIESPNVTVSAASSTINLTSTSTDIRQFFGAGQSYGTVSFSAGSTAHPVVITGNNTFGTLQTAGYIPVQLENGQTQNVTNFNITGAAGNVVKLYSRLPGQRATINKATAAIGANSTDGGNNSGLTFTGTSPNYLYVKDMAYLVSYTGASNFFAFF